MTPSERVRRIDAAAAEWNDSFMDARWSELSEGERTVHRQVVRRALDAADAAVPTIAKSKLGDTLGQLERDRSEFFGRAERAEAAARDFWKALRMLDDWHGDERTYLLISETRDRHPSFSGEEGTEG